MVNLNSVMIGSENVKKLAEVYEKVIGKKPEMVEEGQWYGFVAGNTFLSLGAHSEVHGEAKEPQRVILNFETKDVKGEFERISKIDGVTVVKEPYTMGEDWDGLIATFADPDGNYFQLMTPWDGGNKDHEKSN